MAKMIFGIQAESMGETPALMAKVEETVWSMI